MTPADQVRTILSAPTFVGRDLATEYVAPDGKWIRWTELKKLAETQFSSGELLLVNAAYSLFGMPGRLVGDQRHEATVGNLRDRLDRDHLEVVVAALGFKRPVV